MRPAARLAFLAYCLICLAALVWPGYPLLGNRIRPFILGLPFSLAWVVGWVALTFLVLLLFHAANRDGRRP